MNKSQANEVTGGVTQTSMNSMKTTYAAIAYGHTFSRTSKRTFTHCVIVRDRNFNYLAAAWCGSHVLACKAQARLTNIPVECVGYIYESVVVPVTCVIEVE
jgi:hypothetical protein